MDFGVEEVVAVVEFTVFVEGFSVVGGEYDGGLVVEVLFLEGGNHAAKLCVHALNFGVVEIAHVIDGWL